MKQSRIKPGMRFENIIIIEVLNKMHIEPNGHRRRLVIVKCDCGNQFEMILLHVTRVGNNCKLCVNANKKCVKIGEKYDKLLIISFLTNKHGKSMARCQCECGKFINVRNDNLIKNKSNNCGCVPPERKGYEEISGTFFYRIKRNAAIRNLYFNITIEYIWKLYLNQNRKCILSGIDIPFAPNRMQYGKNEASLDRIDSKLGYIEGNVQWVHKHINRMKLDYNQEYFINICKNIANHNK